MYHMLQFRVIIWEGKKYLVEDWDSCWPNNPAYGPKKIVELF